MENPPTSSRHKITNFEQLATTNLRRAALAIAESALWAIDTDRVIRNMVSLHGTLLRIDGAEYDLSRYTSLRIIGFGKVSCQAAETLESILGTNIHSGIAIGTRPSVCQQIRTYQGSHPTPSRQNVVASQGIIAAASDLTEKDLVIVVVSGGGSSLLCWPQSECDQSERLYQSAVRAGLNITELNIIRKHISEVKGGGLAKLLFPATVVGLIFSDVPGDYDDMVASGPTYLDRTTAQDAQKIIDEHKLGSFDLTETPKDGRYFQHVRNIRIASNKIALDAMSETARNLGFKAIIADTELYDYPEEAFKKMTAHANQKTAVLAGGEIRLKVKVNGSGGRNLYFGMAATQHIAKNQLFIGLASDGLDNSDAAGGITDAQTLQSIDPIDAVDYLKRNDGYAFFKKTGDLIFSGPTGSNVSDLYILLQE